MPDKINVYQEESNKLLKKKHFISF